MKNTRNNQKINTLWSKVMMISWFLVLVCSLIVVVFVIPSIGEDRLKKESPKFLKMNGYTIVKDNGFDMWKSQEEFVVEKYPAIFPIVQDTIIVKLVKGSLIIQPKY